MSWSKDTLNSWVIYPEAIIAHHRHGFGFQNRKNLSLKDLKTGWASHAKQEDNSNPGIKVSNQQPASCPRKAWRFSFTIKG